MPENYDSIYDAQDRFERSSKIKESNHYLFHIGLLLFTFCTTTIAGAEWISGQSGPYEFSFLLKGLPYSICILFVIGTHEFGHYFASKLHKVKATLPYFLPCPSIGGFLNFGTFGAVIRTKSAIRTRNAMFDIGAAGPIAGFVACLIVLVYGFTHLPGREYILAIHPDYFSPSYGKNGIDLKFGNTILFSFLKMVLVKPGSFVPPMSEVYHYPYLCVGWFGLFITSMNMLPVGQLDGGHISYSMFGGNNHYKISVVTLIVVFILGLTGMIEILLNLGFSFGWSGWLFWALILFFVVKIRHPHIYDDEPIDIKRKILGWISFIIFILSFSPSPFIIALNG